MIDAVLVSAELKKKKPELTGASAKIKEELLDKFAGKNSKWVKQKEKKVEEELESFDEEEKSEEENYAVGFCCIN